MILTRKNRWARTIGFFCLLPALALLASCLAAPPADATTYLPICVQVNSFDTSNVSSSGSSSSLLYALTTDTTTYDGALRVVQNLDSQASTVVRRSPVKLTGGFSTFFVMNLHDKTSEDPADGLSFVVQDNSAPQVGAYGQGIGYKGIGGDSFAAEFDIYNNSGSEPNGENDPNANHVAIDQNGVVDHSNPLASTVDASPGFNLYGSGDIYVWVDYDTSGLLTVTYSQSATRSGARSISKNVGTALNDKDVYVGFAASTGGSNADHDIKKWYFDNQYVSGGLDPNGDYAQGVGSISAVLSSGTNPQSAVISSFDADGARLSTAETVSVYLDGNSEGTVAEPASSSVTYSIPGLSVGSHTLKVVAGDGGASDTEGFTVNDTTPPSAPTITTPGYTGGNWTNGSVSFTIGGSSDPETGVSYYRYSTDGGGTWNTGASGTISAAGTYTLVAEAVNGAGLISSSSASVTVEIDRTQPAVTTTNTDYAWKSANITVPLTYADTGGSGLNLTQYQLSQSTTAGASWTDYTGPITISDDSGPGQWYIYFKATDSAGNQATGTFGPYKLDKTNPVVTTGDTDFTTWRNAAFNVTLNYSDAPSGLATAQYAVTDSTAAPGAWTTAAVSAIVPITGEGTWYVHYHAVDNVGNQTTGYFGPYKLDETSPAGSIAITPDTTVSSVKYTKTQVASLTLTASDPATNASDSGQTVSGPYQMRFSNTAGGITAASWETWSAARSGWALTAGNGQKTVYYQIEDLAGNLSPVYSDTIVFDNQAPAISISVPNQYVATKGDTVEYIATFADNSAGFGVPTITNGGVNYAADLKTNAAHYVVLNSIGSVDISKLSVAISDVTGQLLQKKIDITVGTDATGEGTVGVGLIAGTASDNEGNQAAAATCNFSFSVDMTPPTDQGVLFPSSQTVKGGSAVTLATTSQAAGGLASDSVRFAPAGYDGTVAANGVTVTSTHGASNVINAPATPGTYYLYVIDAAGNISQPSAAILTVKNDGPTVTVSGPSRLYVQASSTVSYTVTYSSDASSITLSQQDVALVTTGTANAYVSVSDVTGEPLQKLVTLSNLMGEGTVEIRLAADTAEDSIGNPSAASNASDPVTVDNTPPSLTAVDIVSGNHNPGWAKKGDTLTLNFTSSEAIQAPSVTICGQSVTGIVYTGNQDHWTATYTIPGDSTLNSLDGQAATFSITATDLAGNTATPVTTVTSGAGVQLDFTPPLITVAGTTDTNGNYISPVTVSFNEGTASLSKDGGVIGSGLASGILVTPGGSYSATVTDSAGNASTKGFVVTGDYTHMESDKDSLAIGYAPGDSSSSVTRNVSLPATGVNGSAVTWISSDSTYISVDGSVYRSVYSDQTVNLTATLIKGAYSDTRDFTLTVKKLPGASGGSGGSGVTQEDADTIVIGYAAGDSASSVTQNVYLPAVGGVWGSAITWSSDSGAISVAGSVYRPAFTSGDSLVTMTAQVSLNGSTTDRSFDLTVKRIPGTAAEKAQEDAGNIIIGYASGDSASSVTRNVSLPLKGTDGSGITWQTAQPACLSVDGAVYRPALGQGDCAVSVTATVYNNGATVQRTFNLVVKETGYSDQTTGDVQNDLDNVAIGYAAGDSASSVTRNISLPLKGTSGSSVSWATSDPAAISSGGSVERPAAGAGDVQVTLTATVAKNGVSDTRTFTLTVKQQTGALSDQLQEDADNIAIGYAAGDSASSVTRSVSLPPQGTNGSSVTWTSSLPSVIGADGTVTRPASDTAVVLTARLAKGGLFTDKSFTLTVIKAAGIDIESDCDSLAIGYANGDDTDSATKSLYLPSTGATGSTVTWTSSRPDLIGVNGWVTRPGPDDTDRYVILTATITNPQTGQTATKTFTVLVKKLSDSEAAQQAARDLTTENAFNFTGSGDNWESVTSPFLMLTAGDYSTTINWSSGNSQVISIGGATSGQDTCSAAVYRQTDDTQVILTAVLTRNGCSATKTFLMIVKSADLTKTPATTRQDTGRTVEATAGSASGNFEVLRTTMSDGEKIDTVILDVTKMQTLTGSIDPSGATTVALALQQPAADPADEQTVEIPADAVQAMADHNASLEITAGAATISIPAEVMQAIANSGTDLYFRVMPLNGSGDIDAMKSLIASDPQMQSAAGSDKVEPQGNPSLVETNYTGFSTSLVLPFTGSNAEYTQSFLSALRVFVKHSDGTTEVETGTIVYENGVPYGIEIEIGKFSTFQIVELVAPGSSDNVGGGGGGGGVSTVGAPTVQTGAATAVTANSAALNGDIVAGGSSKITEYGFLWGASSSALTNTLRVGTDSHSGSFTATLGSLTAGTAYYFQAYATNGAGEAKGNIVSFTAGASQTSTTPAEPTSPATFSDVPASNWAHDDIGNLSALGYVTGYPDGTFGPDRQITRAEFVTIMDRVLKLAPYTLQANTFTDVNQRNWFYQSVQTAVYAGIAKGYGDGTFRPDAPISRQEMACVLVQALGKAELADSNAKNVTKFTDDNNISWWSRGYIFVARQQGIIVGYPDNSFQPGGNATRGEACAMIENFLKSYK